MGRALVQFSTEEEEDGREPHVSSRMARLGVIYEAGNRSQATLSIQIIMRNIYIYIFSLFLEKKKDIL